MNSKLFILVAIVITSIAGITYLFLYKDNNGTLFFDKRTKETKEILGYSPIVFENNYFKIRGKVLREFRQNVDGNYESQFIVHNDQQQRKIKIVLTSKRSTPNEMFLYSYSSSFDETPLAMAKDLVVVAKTINAGQTIEAWIGYGSDPTNAFEKSYLEKTKKLMDGDWGVLDSSDYQILPTSIGILSE